jgi:hypothetical protein
VRRRWPEVRAGLIAIAIFFGLVDGCPLPPPADTPDWEKGFVEPLRAVKDFVETPVAWIQPRLRVAQRWALYQAPGSQRYRMSIEGHRADGTWQILYRAADPEHDEDAAMIESGRVWGSWDPLDRPAPQYTEFCAWITARFLAAHPEIDAARVRQELVYFEPGRVIGENRYVYEYMRRRR